LNYQYIDIIPAKVIFRVEKSANLTLLKPFFNEEDNLSEIWKVIEKEHQDISPEKDDKSLDIYKNVEGLKSKYESILLSVKYLSQLWDDELADSLISLGYALDKSNYINLQDVSKIESHQNQLEIIGKQSEGILFKINNALSRLEKTKGKSKNQSEISFEQTIIAYSSFIRAGYIDPNKITLVEYYALINLGAEKIKALEKTSSKGGKAK
jgi:hypothetical protein